MTARYALAVSAARDDQRFDTLDALADALLALIEARRVGETGLVTLRDANLARGEADGWHGECVSVRRGAARDGDLIAYVLTRPPGRDDRARLVAALSRADDRWSASERAAA